MIDGILLIDKPAGPTSHDVVAKVRRLLGRSRVGHTGTLDPAATGLLVIMLGKATRILTYLSDDKEYEGTITLGIATDTLDAAGAVLEKRPVAVEEKKIREAAAAMTGAQGQTPPMVSAVKIDGKPLYKLARKGIEVERAERRIEIFSFDILGIGGGADYPEIDIRVACTKGTYIRVLAADFGARIGCPAHLSRLRRIGAGDFSVRDALTMEELEDVAGKGGVSGSVIPLRDSLPGMAEIFVDDTGRSDASQGRTLAAGGVINVRGKSGLGDFVKIIAGNDLICIAKVIADSQSFDRLPAGSAIARPKTVFV